MHEFSIFVAENIHPQVRKDSTNLKDIIRISLSIEKFELFDEVILQIVADLQMKQCMKATPDTWVLRAPFDKINNDIVYL